MVPWQWIELSTARIAAVGPNFNPGAGLVGGYRAGRVDAWNGMAALGTSVYMAGVGGHTDWGGNEGYRCDLAAASPVWVMLSAPTPESLMAIDVTHYGDGRPTASHTYYSLHADEVRNKIFRMGVQSAYGSGNFQRRNVDAFDLARNDWDTANTWPSLPEDLVYAKSQTQNASTGDIYVVGNSYLWRFARVTGAWTRLAAVPPNGSATYGRASVVDTKRNKMVVLGDAYRTPVGILVYDIASDRWDNTRSLSGSSALAVSAALANGAHYDRTVDRYIVKTSTGGEIVSVHPDTLEATPLATTGGANVPGAINGVYTKFVAVRALGGYAYLPNGSSNLWFLAGN